MSVKRTLLVAKILKEKTDINNKLTTKELINYLNEEGYKVTRNTITEDINSLIESGEKIVISKCSSNRKCYYYESQFSIEECRIILDSIYSNKFINSKYKEEIREKILSNISKNNKVILKNNIVIEEINTMGIDVSYNLFMLHKALTEKVYIDFISVTRDVNKKMIEKKKVTNFIPKRIYYYNDRYYLIGFNENKEKRHYRIDRIYKVILKEFHKNSKEIDLKNYGLKNFDMFGSEKLEVIELKINKNLINSVIEKFGDEVDIHKCLENDSYYIFSSKVGINKGLVRWILKQGNEVEVIHPSYLIEKIKEEIEKMKKIYEKE